MKRNLVIVAVVAGLALAYFGSRLLAQAPATSPAPTAAGTRIGVINIAAVFRNYEKAKFFEGELKNSLAPLKAEVEKMRSDIVQWQTEGAKGGPPTSKYTKQQCEEAILTLKRKLEDKQREAQTFLQQKTETQLTQLWKEINDVIERTARANSFNIVLSFGEPTDVDANGPGSVFLVQRKFQIMDAGGTALIYSDRSVNITSVVTDTLNAAYRAASQPGTGQNVPAQPVSRPN